MEIQTAEELLLEIMSCLKMNYSISELNENDETLVPHLIQLINTRTKSHVTAALECAKVKVDEAMEPYCSDHTPYRGNCVDCGRTYNPEVIKDEEALKEAILNSYPLDNIK